MNWNELTSEDQLEQIKEESKVQPILIFKHSNTCNISQMMLGRLERNWKTDSATAIKPYFLNLRSFRAVSNKVADVFNVEHESPQVLVVRNGKPVHVSSHMAINFDSIKDAATDSAK